MPTLSKRQWIMAFVIVAVFFGSGVQYGLFRAEKESTNAALIAGAEHADSIFVAIEGAVENPGMYEMSRGDRLADLLALAVLADNADLWELNRAQKLVDEDFFKIPTKKASEDKTADYVPSKPSKVITPATASASVEEVVPAKVNIATASIEQLMTLSGITQSKAADIITYRQATPFVQTYDLQNVKSITAADWLNLKDLITIH